MEVSSNGVREGKRLFNPGRPAWFWSVAEKSPQLTALPIPLEIAILTLIILCG
jgi:hypothetical protein